MVPRCDGRIGPRSRLSELVLLVQRRRHALIAVVLTMMMLAGCGSQESASSHDALAQRPRTGATSSQPGAPSNSGGATPARRHLLVYFKEVYGVDPLASYLTVYTTGQAVAVIIEGGTDGASVRRFELSAAQLRKLRRLVLHTRLRNTTCCENLNGWIFWVTTRVRSARLQQASIPRSSRPLVNMLYAITQANTIY